MAQIKRACSVTNGGQTVAIAGVNLTDRIRKNSIFMVEGDLVPYTVAANSTYSGGKTNVTLTGAYQGATNTAAQGVFATDMTYPDMIPTIAQGDVGTAAIFTAAMYRIQNMILGIDPDGLANYADIYEQIVDARDSIATAAGLVSTVPSQVTAANNAAQAAEDSAVIADAAADTALGYRNTASGHASTASGHATTANTKAGEASTSAALAQNWATSLSAFAGSSGLYGARKYATDAAASTTLAQDWATKTASPVSAGQYGAKYYSDLALGHAGTATTKAGEAAQSASDALGYRNTASTHAGNASAFAGTATTKAGEASDSAAAALASKNLAAQYATKTDAVVNGTTDYSAKYWAQQAQIYAQQASTGQQQIDWNASSGITSILNKPSLSAVATSGAYGDLTGRPSLATVATTGAYADLSGRPTIPTNTNQLTNGSGFVTQSGARTAISATGSLSYNSTTGVISYTAPILHAVATSGSYNDLSERPNIPAAQVSADWNASSGVAKILNKPTLATVATTGSYNDLSDKPTVVGQVNSDWNAVGGSAQILNKPALAAVAITGSYNDLSDKPTASLLAEVATTGQYSDLEGLPSIPTNTSQLTNNSGFITAAGAPVQSVAGRTGAVTLTKSDVGLNNVENMTAAQILAGNAATATKLAAPVNINGVPFDGSASINIEAGASLPAGGTSTNFLRGDGVWAVLDADDVGLGNVNNTSDADKPVSTATQTQLSAKLSKVAGNEAVSELKTASFSSVYNAGNSGSARTIHFANGQKQRVTLTAAAPTITVSGAPGVGHYQLIIYQDATGNRAPTIVGPSSASLAGNYVGSASAPAVSTAASSKTVWTGFWDGAEWSVCSMAKVGSA